jgi:hypothetical protein
MNWGKVPEKIDLRQPRHPGCLDRLPDPSEVAGAQMSGASRRGTSSSIVLCSDPLAIPANTSRWPVRLLQHLDIDLRRDTDQSADE